MSECPINNNCIEDTGYLYQSCNDIKDLETCIGTLDLNDESLTYDDTDDKIVKGAKPLRNRLNRLIGEKLNELNENQIIVQEQYELIDDFLKKNKDSNYEQSTHLNKTSMDLYTDNFFFTALKISIFIFLAFIANYLFGGFKNMIENIKNTTNIMRNKITSSVKSVIPKKKIEAVELKKEMKNKNKDKKESKPDNILLNYSN